MSCCTRGHNPWPTDLPDLSIGTVMGQPAAAEPIHRRGAGQRTRTARERVNLALAEMDRTGAWDRSLLMVISPTGTSYLNPARRPRRPT